MLAHFCCFFEMMGYRGGYMGVLRERKFNKVACSLTKILVNMTEALINLRSHLLLYMRKST